MKYTLLLWLFAMPAFVQSASENHFVVDSSTKPSKVELQQEFKAWIAQSDLNRDSMVNALSSSWFECNPDKDTLRFLLVHLYAWHKAMSLKENVDELKARMDATRTYLAGGAQQPEYEERKSMLITDFALLKTLVAQQQKYAAMISKARAHEDTKFLMDVFGECVTKLTMRAMHKDNQELLVVDADVVAVAATVSADLCKQVYARAYTMYEHWYHEQPYVDYADEKLSLPETLA